MTSVHEFDPAVGDGDAAARDRDAELTRLRAEVAMWRDRYSAGRVRDTAYTNSAHEVAPLFTALDVADREDGEVPGKFPYTRGIHPTGYRGKLWTMRQFAGFGTARETNQRYKFLLSQGQTGLSVAFDFPTLMGYDADHVRSEGEVGKAGVSISSLADMEALFDGIPLNRVSTSMTINGPAIILFCFYAAAAEKQGVPLSELQGTVQNDILKEYMAQHAWCFPIEPALRLIVDMFEWCATNTPEVEHDLDQRLPHPRGRLHGGAGAGVHARRRLHVRRAGHRARARRRRLRAAAVVLLGHPQRLLRGDRQAARGAAHLGAPAQEKYGAKDPRSWMMRFHSQTAGVTLTAQQPMNNVVRVAYQAMAGGARRHAVAAHQLDGRDARAPDRGERAGGAAHAADPRLRDGRAQRRPTRSAGRTTSRRSPTSSSATPSGCSRRSTRKAAWSRGSRRAGSSGASPRARPGSSGSSSSAAR
jgi:methylmalonyl-CoA mutase N-terminal domain/subunit